MESIQEEKRISGTSGKYSGRKENIRNQWKVFRKKREYQEPAVSIQEEKRILRTRGKYAGRK